jgi:hypothetical protein
MQTESRVSAGGAVQSVTQFTYDADDQLRSDEPRRELKQ